MKHVTWLTTIVGIAAGLAQGQCSGYVLEPGPGALTGQVSAITVWDPDGSGPAPSTLVAMAGNSGGYVKIWDGAAWQPFGPPSAYLVGVTNFNGDLIAGGGGWSVSRWNGNAWVQFGDNQEYFPGAPRNFAIHQGQLYATCAASFFRLNGATWQDLGPSSGEYANAIVSFRGELIGGGYLRLGIPFVEANVVRWVGAPEWWSPVGSEPFNFVYQLAVHNDRLIAVGDYLVQQWDGATWEALGGQVSGREVTSYNGQLIVAGGIPGAVARWDGVSWQALGGGVGGTFAQVARMVEWNGDLILAGKFTTAGGLPAGNIARYRCIPCYANCDNSLNAPVLNANDFQCFLNKFAAAESYANCDGSVSPPVLTANDFQCFLNRFAAGCT